MSRIKSRKGNRADNSWMQLDEQDTPFLAPDAGENATSVATELRDRMVKIEQQVLAGRGVHRRHRQRLDQAHLLDRRADLVVLA